jgi:hypothetical protein
MRAGLMDAQAAVDWTASQIPIFEKKLIAWCADNVEVTVEELEPPATNDLILGGAKSDLPLAFQVEAGAYINVLRSGLDMLATTLAHRHGMTKPEDAYFPVAKSALQWRDGSYKGAKLVNLLPRLDRRVIENLQPYQGGNELLWSLHHLDIVRKHRRLLAAPIDPKRFQVKGPPEIQSQFTIPGTWGVRSHDDKTVLLLAVRGAAANCEFNLTIDVSLDEPGTLLRQPIVAVLEKFSRLVSGIITLFDHP